MNICRFQMKILRNCWIDGVIYESSYSRVGSPPGSGRGLYNYQDKYLLAVLGERLYRLDKLDNCVSATHLFDLNSENNHITFTEMPHGRLCLSDGWRHWILNMDLNTLEEVKL